MSVLRCVAVLAVALLCSSGALAQQSFTFTTVSTLQGNGLWGAVDQYLRPLNRPEAYVSAFNTTGDSSSTWGVAPAGSFLLWGTQPDISLSPDQGTTWWYVAGTTAGSGNGTDRRTVNPNFPGVPNVAVGNTGCSHRASFNRFYLIGNNNGGSNQTQTLNSFTGGLVNVWFAWASNDGSIWNQVMSNATAFAMASSRNTNGGSVTQDHVCVVDSLDNAYDIGSSDTWKSVNLGVGWAAVASTSYFPARWGLSAAIYSPTATSDVMVVLGGTNNVTGALLNDVWTSSTGGQSWSMLATAPWPPRQEPNFAINSNGVMVVYGGDCGGGWCGVSGDAWVSVNGGSQWYQLSSTLSNFTLTALAFDNAGYLWLVGGQEGITGNDYDWTSAVQKSSLSFSTSAISQWSQTYTGGQTFTVNAQTLAALQNGPAPQGGNQSNTNSSIAYVSAFSCAATTLPNTGAAFNMTFLNNGRTAQHTLAWPTGEHSNSSRSLLSSLVSLARCVRTVWECRQRLGQRGHRHDADTGPHRVWSRVVGHQRDVRPVQRLLARHSLGRCSCWQLGDVGHAARRRHLDERRSVHAPHMTSQHSVQSHDVLNFRLTFDLWPTGR